MRRRRDLRSSRSVTREYPLVGSHFGVDLPRPLLGYESQICDHNCSCASWLASIKASNDATYGGGSSISALSQYSSTSCSAPIHPAASNGGSPSFMTNRTRTSSILILPEMSQAVSSTRLPLLVHSKLQTVTPGVGASAGGSPLRLQVCARPGSRRV